MLMSCKEKKYSYISVYWEKKSSTKKKEISLFQRQTEADFFEYDKDKTCTLAFFYEYPLFHELIFHLTISQLSCDVFML